MSLHKQTRFIGRHASLSNPSVTTNSFE